MDPLSPEGWFKRHGSPREMLDGINERRAAGREPDLVIEGSDTEL